MCLDSDSEPMSRNGEDLSRALGITGGAQECWNVEIQRQIDHGRRVRAGGAQPPAKAVEPPPPPTFVETLAFVEPFVPPPSLRRTSSRPVGIPCLRLSSPSCSATVSKKSDAESGSMSWTCCFLVLVCVRSGVWGGGGGGRGETYELSRGMPFPHHVPAPSKN